MADEKRTRLRGEPAGRGKRLDDPDPAVRHAVARGLLEEAPLLEPGARSALLERVTARLAAEKDIRVAALLLRLANRLRSIETLGRDPSRSHDTRMEEGWATIDAMLRGQVRPAAPEAGTSLADRYEVQELVNTGGMSRIYLARRRTDGVAVAIKILREEYLAEGSTGLERFRREAAITEEIRHPHIVRTFEHGVFEGRPFIVTEYMARGSLADHVGRIPPSRARRILADAANALAWLHARGLVHRDVKPANILIDDGWRGKLADFGLARDPGRGTLTVAGQVFGSPAYMAPEQRKDPASVTGAADVYSLGVSIYEVLSGGDLPAPDYVPLAPGKPDVPAGIDDLVRACLRGRPEERPDAGTVERTLR